MPNANAQTPKKIQDSNFKATRTCFEISPLEFLWRLEI
jgi:hypothetical protein